MFFGWYSPKMAELYGTVYYYASWGGRVEVTLVTENEEHGVAFDDVECVGAVTKYSHQGAKGEYSYRAGDAVRSLLAYNADVELFGAVQ